MPFLQLSTGDTTSDRIFWHCGHGPVVPDAWEWANKAVDKAPTCGSFASCEPLRKWPPVNKTFLLLCLFSPLVARPRTENMIE
eukprot:9630614-Prorocentrum_lima.AAC.1